MKPFVIALAMFWLSLNAQANPEQDYLARFTAYSFWNENLPDEPDDAFAAFINSDAPLSNKLRNKWLYHLASQKNWSAYKTWYRPTTDQNLQCFAHRADFYLGHTEEALNAAQTLWLNGETLPVACDVLFNMLLQSPSFDETLITRRIAMALDKQNVNLARYLLKQYKKPRLQDEQLLTLIAQNPTRIALMGPGESHGDFYLYGLKRLVTTNSNGLDRALGYWKLPKTRKLLSPTQQQDFLVQVALYKAMRGNEDADAWFARVKPAWYNDVLIDWQIRYALKRGNWPRVIHLISIAKNKDDPAWQYWLARAEEATGASDAAHRRYESLARSRNYYGFLASQRLNIKPGFENEANARNAYLLKPYRPVLDKVETLYKRNQAVAAFRLLNDFLLELPKQDKSAVIYWIANNLQWHDKSIYFSNCPELNNQLALRFPLAHLDSVKAYSKSYHVPQEFIYAIIRQESSFRSDVISPAGAHGLMQIMPATARVIAKSEKIQYKDKNQLFLSQTNIHIGVAYLHHLGKRFHQHPLLIAAAYNAGPRQASRWMRDQPAEQVDIWIETLPWRETRNYLKNILAFYMVYQYRLNQKPDISAFLQAIPVST